MSKIKLVVERQMTERSDDSEGIRAFHAERAKLIHGLVDSLDLDVRSWGDTDSERPREVVEVIVALGTAGVFTAMVSAFRVWVSRRKIRDVVIEGPKGSIRMRDATASDVSEIARAVGLKLK
jgi:hypothetical protein